ncbi:MAG: hypothetical protein R3F59_24230 [Myxococcota bacterium]
MIALWTAIAAAAPCDPVPAPLVSRWPLLADGRDIFGDTPLASVGRVGWPAVWADPASSWVTLTGDARLEATGVALPSEWLLELRADLGDAPGELLRVVDGFGRWVALSREPGRLVLTDDAEHWLVVDLPDGEHRVGIGRGGGQVAVLVDGALVDTPWADAAPPDGVAAIRVGASGGVVRVRDLVLHAEVAAYGATPWCTPPVSGPVPRVEPEPKGPQLEFGGAFLGWIGWVPGNRFVARQRLLLEPTVRLSRHTRVTVAVRALDARSVDRTGSTLQPVPPGASVLGEYGLVVEHAYLARWVGEWRLLPFYFVAGRVPLTFGMGLDDRNALATLSPPPVSTTALLDAGHLRGIQPGNGDQFGAPRNSCGREARGRVLVGLRGGRHNPWCASRSGPVCPDLYAPTYEFVVTGLGEQHLVSGPLSGADGLAVVTEGGARWAYGLRPSVFGRVAVAYDRPRADLLWVSGALEGLLSTGIRGGDDLLPGDPGLPAPQFRGDVVALAARLDAALRPLAWETLTVEGGGTGGVGGIGPAPVRGLHPDYNVDLVLFNQVVAAATAQADPAVVVPTLGGVVDAGFFRIGGTTRIGARSGIEVPLFVVTSWALAPLPGVMDAGPLGTELDGALRLHSGDWRLTTDVGVLVHPGRALGTLGRAHPASVEVRIGREL